MVSRVVVVLLLVEILVTIAAVVADALATKSTPLPHCREKCGNISIPYPFGAGAGCFREGFEVRCDDSESPPKLLVDTDGGTLEVADIFLSAGELRVKAWIGRDCYHPWGSVNETRRQSIDLTSKPFAFSYTRNKFTAVGCDTVGNIRGIRYMGDAFFFAGSSRQYGYIGGCVSYFEGARVNSLSCDGMGCCQASIPRGLKRFNTSVGSNSNHTNDWDFNPCGYAFVTEDRYQFAYSNLNDPAFYAPMPIVLDWSVGNSSCGNNYANSTSTTAVDYACRSGNSHCLNASNPASIQTSLGYICNCSAGYEGNPYLDDGCQDINECADPGRYPCKGNCTNTPGSYKCSCPPGTTSEDPRQNPCVPISGIDTSGGVPLFLKLGLGLGIGLLVLATASSWAYWGFQKRRLVQLKHQFFQQNGGLFLQQQISANKGNEAFRIFTEEEMAKATGNFGDDKILGRGGHGTVYKGTLEDGKVVAIKKSKMVDERQNKEFAKEMHILSQINHRNIVKLLGCCLEVQVPMLVYEYVPNGTLFDYIHRKQQYLQHAVCNNPLDNCLRIAAEGAEALAYLHSYASPPILHGDIKSSNILLDGSYVAKVSDFGASILAPLDKDQLATVVQGTWGYLDPEYMQTCQLTEKSDVYSFGVVLAELLTGRKALYLEGPEEERCLAMMFITSMRENKLLQIVDARDMGDWEMGKLLEVAELTKCCLNLKGEDRPTMKEVAMALQVLRASQRALPKNPEEVESLLWEASPCYLSRPESSALFDTEGTTGLRTF